MDFWLYVSSLQDRLFIALMGLLLACVIDTVAAVLFSNRADPRPLLEQFTDFIMYGTASRLNKSARGQGALVMRGTFILAVLCAAYYAAAVWGLAGARQLNISGPYLVILLACSTGVLGWFGPLRALAAHLNNPKAPRPFQVLSRATYTNMVTLDESGLIRVSASAAVQSITVRLVGPVLVYALFGLAALAVYWPIMVMALSLGQSGLNRGFALMANVFARLLLIIPSLLALPLMLCALLFSAGASFFRALPGLFAAQKWPPLLQGGLAMLMTAYAMKITLGGPRQDRQGTPVAAAWVGASNATAKLLPRDIGRILYLQMVCALLLGVVLYIFSIVPIIQ